MPADTPDDDPLRIRYDEAFASDGTPREHYAAVIQAILESGPGALASAMTAAARTAGLSLGTGSAARLLPVDPVPRVFAPGEWSNLEAGLIQRARMLEAVVGGIYGGPSLPDGVLPEGVVSTSVYLERDLSPPGCSRSGIPAASRAPCSSSVRSGSARRRAALR